jgi:hypothetical protein
VRVSFKAPAANGLAISGYEVDASDGTAKTVGAGATSVDFTVTNGKAYTFRVKAKNADGWSDLSPSSASITTYGNPASPGKPSLKDNNSHEAPAKLTATWSAVTATGGGTVTYEVSVNGGAAVAVTGTSYSIAKQPAGTYTVRVRAVANPGGRRSAWSPESNSITLKNPDPSVSLSKGARTGVNSQCSTGNCYYYVVHATHFKGGSYTLTLNCQGDYLASYRVDVPASGDFNFNSINNTGKPFCGYPDTWVDFSGGPSGNVSSSHMDFSG